MAKRDMYGAFQDQGSAFQDQGGAYHGDTYSINQPESGQIESMFGDEPKADSMHKSSAARAAYNVICTVVGTGLLQLPYALQQSGWIGVAMLIVMALMAMYTATILIKCLNPPSGRRLVTYGDIGYEAFGIGGQVVVEIMLHMTLLGVSTIYLILASNNISSLLAQVPTEDDYCAVWNVSYHYTSLIIAGILWLHVFLKTLHEVGVLSMFNICVAFFLLVVVVLEIALNFPSQEHVKHDVVVWGIDLGGAFASFSFSFGAHAILPSVYETMEKPKEFNKMIIGSFGAILVFYLPLAIIGYWAYGTGTVSPIYDNLCTAGTTCSLTEKLGVYMAVLSVTVHIMFSYAIVINPTELAVERLFKVDGSAHPLLYRVLLRTCLVGVTLAIGELVKNFGDFLDLVSAVTNSFTSFILPCLFFLRLFWKSVSYPILLWNVLIIVAALLGFGFGGYDALAAVLCDITEGSVSIFPPGQGCPPQGNATVPFDPCF